MPIGEWALRTACAQNAAWQAAGLSPLTMSVNFSFRQFQHKGIVDIVKKILQETGMAPEWLCIEISEACAMMDIDSSLHILDALHALKIDIAIDDFGTGFSSLFYLKRFPLHSLKIDQSFISRITSGTEAKEIISAMIATAHALKLKVVAEAVEHEEELHFLESQHCEAVQGNLYCQPLPPSVLNRLLQEGRFLSRAFELHDKADKKINEKKT